ncbi:MAG: glycosyltransferase family 4 protein [Kiritimatiellia bacterium]
MMRILNLAYTCPWPPHGGNDQRVWHLCRLLGRTHHQELLCRAVRREDAGQYPRFHGEPIEVHNLFLPRPGPLRRLIKGLRYLAGTRPLLSAGFDFHPFTVRLKELIRDGRFDIIVMDGIWLGIYWPLIQSSGALRVLNHFDREAVSLRRHARLFPPGWRRALYSLDASRMERLERRVIGSADLVWVTSEVDRDAIMRDNPALPVQVAANGVDCEEISARDPVPSRELLFVGTLSQYANSDAVTYFVREVFPLLKARVPDAVFRVIGRNPSPEILALGRVPGIEITGPVDDLSPWYQRCAAAVVPIRAGGGTRLKILEAMAYGRPVVSTAIGCEGIQAETGRHLVVADRPSEMADALRDVLTRPQYAAQLSREARKLVEERYSWHRIASRMQAVYEEAVKAKEAARKRQTHSLVGGAASPAGNRERIGA